MGWISYPCLSQKSQVKVENLCSSINESNNPDVTYKYISFIYPLNYCYGSIWPMIFGAGNDSYWLGFGASTGTDSSVCSGAGEGSAVVPPSLSLKVLHFECWGTCVEYAPNPGSYNIGFGFEHSPSLADFDYFQQHHYFSYHFAFGSWAIATGILIVISLTPV